MHGHQANAIAFSVAISVLCVPLFLIQQKIRKDEICEEELGHGPHGGGLPCG